MPCADAVVAAFGCLWCRWRLCLMPGFENQQDSQISGFRSMTPSIDGAKEEQPSGRKRSSSFWSEQRPASRTSASGPTTRTEEVKMDGSKDAFRGQIQAAQELKMGAAGARSQLKNSPGTPWSGSGSTGSTSAASPSDSNLSELSDSEDDRSPESSDCEDDSRPLVPTPSHDHRPPVVDSYDVVEAVKHFASQRTADPKEQQKEDKLTEIQIKESQMKQLRSSSKNMHFKPEVRAHYAKICKEIENEKLCSHHSGIFVDAEVGGQIG
eukprot:s3579_g7.t1